MCTCGHEIEEHYTYRDTGIAEPNRVYLSCCKHSGCKCHFFNRVKWETDPAKEPEEDD